MGLLLRFRFSEPELDALLREANEIFYKATTEKPSQIDEPGCSYVHNSDCDNAMVSNDKIPLVKICDLYKQNNCDKNVCDTSNVSVGFKSTNVNLCDASMSVNSNDTKICEDFSACHDNRDTTNKMSDFTNVSQCVPNDVKLENQTSNELDELILTMPSLDCDTPSRLSPIDMQTLKKCSVVLSDIANGSTFDEKYYEEQNIQVKQCSVRLSDLKNNAATSGQLFPGDKVLIYDFPSDSENAGQNLKIDTKPCSVVLYNLLTGDNLLEFERVLKPCSVILSDVANNNVGKINSNVNTKPCSVVLSDCLLSNPRMLRCFVILDDCKSLVAGPGLSDNVDMTDNLQSNLQSNLGVDTIGISQLKPESPATPHSQNSDHILSESPTTLQSPMLTSNTHYHSVNAEEILTNQVNQPSTSQASTSQFARQIQIQDFEQSSQIQNTIPLPSSSLNISRNSSGNISPNFSQNVPPNISQSASPNFNQNVPSNISQNASPNIGQNIPSNISQNASPNINQNVPPNVRQNVSPNINQNVPPNTSQNASPDPQNQSPNASQSNQVNQPSRSPSIQALQPFRIVLIDYGSLLRLNET